MSDLISRQAVLDYPIRLDHYDEEHGNLHFVLGIESVMEYVEHLPSADRPMGEWIDGGNETTSMVSEQIEELRKYARKWSEWNGFDAAMPVLPSTNIRLLYSAADTIEALNRPTGVWIKSNLLPNGWNCDNCGSPIMTDDISEMLYCPNCGTRMTPYKGGEDE